MEEQNEQNPIAQRPIVPPLRNRTSLRIFSIQIKETFSDDAQIRTPRDALNHYRKTKIRSIAGNSIRVIFAFALPLIMIIVGVVNFHRCPAERFIPIYLIGAGVIGLCKYIKCVMEKLIQNKNPDELYANENDEKFCTLPSVCTLIDALILLIGIAWVIAGSVWVFRTVPSFDGTSSVDGYCNKSTYLTAFATLVLCYLYLAFFFSIIFRYCCIICCNCQIALETGGRGGTEDNIEEESPEMVLCKALQSQTTETIVSESV